MYFRAQALLRAALIFALLILVDLIISCGSSSSSKATVSGLTFRAFVSQDVSIGVSTAFPSGVAAGVFVLDAKLDRTSASFISASGFAWNPGLLVLAPNRKLTLAYSSSNNLVGIIDNTAESASKSISLPGATESIAVSPDATLGYAAINNTSVTGGAPGAVDVMDLSADNIPVTIPVPSAHYLAESHNGNRLLVFSDNSDSVTLIATGNIPPCTPVCGSPSPPPCPLANNSAPNNVVSCSIPGFDRPVAALFSSDDSTAYVLNCGAECGGHTASIQAVDIAGQKTLGAPIPVAAATVGFINGNTLYAAGTPPTSPGNGCGGGSTAATTCGRLSVVDLSARTVTNTQIITDGYHNRIDLSQNGQLFVGSRNCNNISTSAEVRGCLSIFNTLNPAVVIPPANGDVTGIQAISNRDVVYVVQNGELRIYDTTVNKLGPTQIDLNGQIIDVKQVDF